MRVLAPIGMVLWACAATLSAGCGDKFGVSSYSQIEVDVENASFVGTDATMEFSPALQQPAFKKVTILNSGTRDLKVSKVDWAKGEDGKPKKNKYIDIDWQSGVNADSFPWTIDTDNVRKLQFQVKFTPPTSGNTDDDKSDSVIEVSSNARLPDGTGALPIVRITISLKETGAKPQVTPPNYTYHSTPASPEGQDFTIYNDESASGPFTISSITLESPSTRFVLSQLPSQGTVVLARTEPQYKDVVFRCTYFVSDGVYETNAILIYTNILAGPIRIPVSSGPPDPCDFELTYSHADKLDFTNVTSEEKRSVQLTSAGPGTIKIKVPRIEPAEANQDYTLKIFSPATQPGQPETEVTAASGLPRALAQGRSLRFEVTYKPRTDGKDTSNGQLIIPYENPDGGEATIDIFSGDPKSKIVLSPKNGSVSATGSVVVADKGDRSVVVYNVGNGPLEVKDAVVLATFGPGKVWSLGSAFAPFTLLPGELRVIGLKYDLSKIDTNDGSVSEHFDVTYHNDFLGSDETASVGLFAAEANGAANPTADPGTTADYADAVAGETMTLDGSGSTPGSGAFEGSAYVWYLTAKPAGSLSILNVNAGATVAFTPDIAGAYTFELFVFAHSGDTYLYSAPASVTVNVGAAP